MTGGAALFRKLQLKFFGIITSILLAIFIGVLGSINIIMDTVMEHQTKVVLEQVAAGVEYDSNVKTFTFQPPDGKFRDENIQPPYKPDEQPEKPTQTSKASSATATTAASSVSSTSTTAVTTVETKAEEQPAAEVPPPVQKESPAPEPPEAVEVPAPEPTSPPVTTPPASPKVDDDDEDDDDDDDTDNNGDDNDDHKRKPPHIEEPPKPTENNGCDGQFPQWEYHGPWPPWTPWIKDDHDCHIQPQANIMQVPVLDGYTIIDCNESTDIPVSTTQTPSEPPRETGRNFGRNYVDSVPKSLSSIDFFIIMADKDGKYLDIRNSDMTEEVAQQYIDKILDSNAVSGMANNYQFCVEKKSNGTLIVFTDKSGEMNMMKKLKRITVIVGSISVVILSALGYFLSGLIVKPISTAFDKQKQFISDASHELKTPLTVISANADVLAGEIGENKWLTYIMDQTDRMNVLVNDLLNLTRLENNSHDFIQSEFDLSKAITNTALPFECQAFETNKNFVLNIDDGIRTTGSEQHIKQMAAIFIDNALKYSKDGGTVRVSLTTENGRPVFSVYNTGKGVKDSEKDKIFERFYRSDASRNRATGGYGLGLAIAKSIIDKHKFKVSVDNIEGKSICFIVTM